jgi:hypothetical protein
MRFKRKDARFSLSVKDEFDIESSQLHFGLSFPEGISAGPAKQREARALRPLMESPFCHRCGRPVFGPAFTESFRYSFLHDLALSIARQTQETAIKVHAVRPVSMETDPDQVALTVANADC